MVLHKSLKAPTELKIPDMVKDKSKLPRTINLGFQHSGHYESLSISFSSPASSSDVRLSLRPTPRSGSA